MSTAAAEKKIAVCLGSSGAVGQKLLEELVKNPTFSTVLAVVRSPTKVPSLQDDGGKVKEHVVKDMNQLEKEVESAVRSINPTQPVVGFSTLGVGHGTIAMTIDQHRAVDVELNRNFAKGLKNTGKVNHMVFMSSVGSDPTAWAGGPGGAGFPRYLRVKGESEEAVKSVGFDHVSIFRPSAILGIPNTGSVTSSLFPLIHFLLPANMQGIPVQDLAKSMAVRGAQDLPRTESEKLRVFHYPEMMDLIHRTSS